MAIYRIIWTAKALYQLDDICYYIEAHSINAAKKVSRDIRLKAKNLKIFPKIGQEEEQLKKLGQGHRYLVQGNYKIITG